MSILDVPEMSISPDLSTQEQLQPMVITPTNIVVSDHFTGGSIDLSKWTVVSGSGDPAIVDDSFNGGSGALNLQSIRNQIVCTKPLALGTKDFVVMARVRTTAFAPTSVFSIGLLADAGAPIPAVGAMFSTDGHVSSTNWQLYLDNATLTATQTSSRWTPILSPNYSTFKITRSANVLQFYIDATLVHSVPYATNLDHAKLCIEGSSPAAPNSTVTRIDSIILAIAP